MRLPALPWCQVICSPPDTVFTGHFTYKKHTKHIPAWETQAAGNPTGRRPGLLARLPSLHNSVGTPQLLRCASGHLCLLFLGNFFNYRERLLHGQNPDAPLPNNYMRISWALKPSHQCQRRRPALAEATLDGRRLLKRTPAALLAHSLTLISN